MKQDNNKLRDQFKYEIKIKLKQNSLTLRITNKNQH